MVTVVQHFAVAVEVAALHVVMWQAGAVGFAVADVVVDVQAALGKGLHAELGDDGAVAAVLDAVDVVEGAVQEDGVVVGHGDADVHTRGYSGVHPF